jgi:hypothetical protein
MQRDTTAILRHRSMFKSHVCYFCLVVAMIAKMGFRSLDLAQSSFGCILGLFYLRLTPEDPAWGRRFESEELQSRVTHKNMTHKEHKAQNLHK